MAQVNLALVLDGSGSIYSDDWELEKDFAKDVVAAFSGKNLFLNGGTASYVQFDSSIVSSGTFSSLADFNAFVDADLQSQGSTDIAEGIFEGQRLLTLSNNGASGAVMIVITDGNSYITEAEFEADAARAEGTVIFAVGVGASVRLFCLFWCKLRTYFCLLALLASSCDFLGAASIAFFHEELFFLSLELCREDSGFTAGVLLDHRYEL